jgi:hypothetical protein
MIHIYKQYFKLVNSCEMICVPHPTFLDATNFFCSQYPGEKEVTFPPFTCLEADGDPRVERGPHGEMVIFPLKVGPESLCNFPGVFVQSSWRLLD